MIKQSGIKGLLTAALILSPIHVLANAPVQPLFPQHNYSQFTLPAVGDAEHDVLQRYGQPASSQQGHNGVHVWDYGSFRVVFRNSTVSYAAMW